MRTIILAALVLFGATAYAWADHYNCTQTCTADGRTCYQNCQHYNW